jgi:hypothetical protein
MEGVPDIESDHPGLIDACVRLLAPGGLSAGRRRAVVQLPQAAIIARLACSRIASACSSE